MSKQVVQDAQGSDHEEVQESSQQDGGEQEKRVEDWIQQGKELFDTEKYIQAIEPFSMAVAVSEDELARQYLARCYFRLEIYDVAYQHYQYIADHCTDKYQLYGISMVAVIEGIWGNHDRAIELYNSLPATPNNLVNLSITHWKKFKATQDFRCLEAAMEVLEEMDLKESPDYSIRRIYHLKGVLYQAEQKYELANQYYEKALALASEGLNSGQILNDQGSLYIELNDYERAQKILLLARKQIDVKSEIEIAENNQLLQRLAEKQIEEGKKYYKAGKYVEAIEILSSIISKSNRGEVQKYLGRCYFWLENYEAAYRYFLFMSEQGEGDNRDYGASMVAVIMDEIWGKTDQAIRLLESLPSSPRNQVNLLVFYWKKYSQQGDPALLEKIHTSLEQIDEELVSHFTRSKLYHIKGLIYQNENNYHSSEAYYNKALELVENDLLRGRILNDLASLYITSKRFAEAERVLLDARALVQGKSEKTKEENEHLMSILQQKQLEEGKRLFEVGEYKEALHIFMRKCKENPASRFYLARCYFRMEKFPEALKHFEQLTEFSEYRSYGLVMQGVIYAIYEEYTTAIKTIKELPGTAVNLIQKMFILLYIYKATHQESTLGDAERLMKKINHLDVDQETRWRFHLACGMIHQSLGEFFLSRRQYDEGVKSTQGRMEQAKILNELGSLLMEEDELTEAEEVLQRAHQYLKGQPTIELGINYKLLGLLQKRRKNYEGSHDYFKEALKILREKEAYREAAEVNCLLINENKSEFYVSAEYYATLLEYERRLKDIQKEDEKVISILEEYQS